jgi:pimeloyl-ACP methyl ester carboxylesterase
VSLPGTFVSSSAGRVFVHRGGRGAPLVLVHGWMMSHYYFRTIIEALAGEREIIALDLPGHGESDRPPLHAFGYTLPGYAALVDEVLETLGLGSVDVLGASMGGAVALTLAARHPTRVQRLVLAAPAIYPPPYLPLDARLLLSPLGPFLFKHAMSKREFARSCRHYNVRDGRTLNDNFIDYFWARLQRAGGPDAAYACLQMMSALPESNDDIGRVHAPTLLVWGDEDRLVPLAQGKRLVRALGGSCLEIVPASAHLPFVERPDEFLRVVRPFLAASAEEAALVSSSPRRAQSVG